MAQKTITVIGANLFQLAAKYYNDASMWLLIANANSLGTDYIVNGSMTLIIPDADSTYAGGIPLS